MATKVLITQTGQHLISEVKQVENKETKEIVGYWLVQPRVVNYEENGDDGSVSVNFGTFCLVSAETEFSIRAEYVVSILEPRAEVAERYTALVNPPGVNDESDVSAAEDREPVGVTD